MRRGRKPKGTAICTKIEEPKIPPLARIVIKTATGTEEVMGHSVDVDLNGFLIVWIEFGKNKRMPICAFRNWESFKLAYE